MACPHASKVHKSHSAAFHHTGLRINDGGDNGGDGDRVAVATIECVCTVTTLLGKYSDYPHLQVRKLRLKVMDELTRR